jgi:uncharacterized protein YkwD
MKKIILILLACFLTLLFPAATFAYSNSEVVSAVNSTRTQNSLKTLTENKQLNQAAAAKMADIQKYQYWSHDNPVTNTGWVSFIRQAGFKGAAGENLAKGFDSTNHIINAWLNSPSHRANLLSANFNAVGVAIGEVNYSTDPQTVVVLTFGKTRPSIISFFQNLFPSQKTVFALN